MSKLVKQVVVKQLMQHINSNNLDNPHQSAYKTGHSTETALLHIKMRTIPCCRVASLQHLSYLIYRVQSTFDTIDHDTLLKCLKSWFVCAAQP